VTSAGDCTSFKVYHKCIYLEQINCLCLQFKVYQDTLIYPCDIGLLTLQLIVVVITVAPFVIDLSVIE
jgi:hypothetical protein